MACLLGLVGPVPACVPPASGPVPSPLAEGLGASRSPSGPRVIDGAHVLTPIDATARASAACHEVASEFGAWLEATGDLGWPLAPVLLDDGARLPRVSGSLLDEPAPLVHLAAKTQAIDGLGLPDFAGLGERLAATLELRRRTLESSPFLASPRAYVAVDEDVAWSRVLEVESLVNAAGYERLSFVFVDPSRRAPSTPPSSLDDELSKLDVAGPARREQRLAEALAFAYKDCPSAIQLVAQFGHDIPEVQSALVEALPVALEGCGCAVDVAVARAVHARLFGNMLPGAAVTVALAGPGHPAVRTLKARADAAWRDAHGLVVSLGNPQGRIAFAIDDPAPESSDSPTNGGAPPHRKTRR